MSLRWLGETESTVVDVENRVVALEEGVAEDEERAQRGIEVERQEEQLALVAEGSARLAHVVLGLRCQLKDKHLAGLFNIPQSPNRTESTQNQRISNILQLC